MLSCDIPSPISPARRSALLTTELAPAKFYLVVVVYPWGSAWESIYKVILRRWLVTPRVELRWTERVTVAGGC